MLQPITRNFKGLITISGPTKSGKSELAEFLIKDQNKITYIATSKANESDPEWEKRIQQHRSRRPSSWKLIEHPLDICKVIESFRENESILIDSLGGIVEQKIFDSDEQWDLFQNRFIESIIYSKFAIIIVTEEIGWGIVPSTAIGHLFRERQSKLSLLINRHSRNKWLAINGSAIDLDKIGFPIP